MSSAFRNLLNSMMLAAILAIGALLIWAVVGGWSLAVLSQFLYTSTPYDRLVFTYGGEPLVQTTEVGGNITVMRTLDGQPAERTDIQQNYSMLPPSDSQHTLVPGGPFQWNNHISAFAEPSGLPVYWYAMLDTDGTGHAYFVAYDAKTKELLGYLGRQGFRRDLPPLDDQFNLPDGAISIYGMLAGQPQYGAQEPYGTSSDPGAAVFLNGAQALYRIDLARREVTQVKTDGKVESINDSEQPIRISADADAEPKRRVSATSQGFIETRDDGNIIKKRRIIARTPKRIDVMDDAGTVLRSAVLPANVSDRVLQAYLTTDEKVLVLALSDLKHEMNDIYWLAADGVPARHEQVRLGSASSQADAGWLICLGIPSPVASAAIVGYLWPYSLIMTGQEATYGEAFAESLSGALAPFGALVGVSAVLAALAYRRQRRMAEPAAASWAVFVLLLGPAGYLGYVLHRVWPAQSTCRSCGKAAPATLRACPSCAAEVAAPQPRGIEIFA